jgi:hypothetical protein
MLRKDLGGRHDGRGRLYLDADRAHRLFQEKMLGKIGTGAQLRGCMRVFGPTREGIGLTRFKQIVDGIGMHLSEDDALRLFARYDSDGSGHIDLYELVTNLLPKDYSKRTWQSTNYEKEVRRQERQREHFLKVGKKVFQATKYPSGLRQMMEPTVDDVVRMIATKIRTSAKDGHERDFALKMFGSPVNGISRKCFKRTLEKYSIPCSDKVLDAIFDKLQKCGLVAFEKLWRRVMPVDGRVGIGWSKHDEDKVGLVRFARMGKVGKKKLRERSMRLRQRMQQSSSQDPAAPPPSYSSKRSKLGQAQSLPSLGSAAAGRRTYTERQLRQILRQRIISHNDPEKFSYNAFDRRAEIPFRAFRKGLELMGVPATTAQTEAIFKQYDGNTGLVNHRRFFRSIVDPKTKRGWLEQRCNDATATIYRGPATPSLPFIQIRMESLSPAASLQSSGQQRQQQQQQQQHGHHEKSVGHSRRGHRSRSSIRGLSMTPIKKRPRKKKRPPRQDTCPWGKPNGRQPNEEGAF